MRRPLDIPPLSHTDKICLVALAGLVAASCAVEPILDTWFTPPAPEPPAVVVEVAKSEPIASVLQVEEEPILYDASIPLPLELQLVLKDACSEHGVPVCLMLGLIEVESGFQVDADNGVSMGLCQLNSRYYPSDLTPEENIQAGVAHLAGQIERYGGDIQAALRAYNRGFDDGARQYSSAVLDASEKWGCG